MKLTKSTIAATFAALLIGGLAISPASAKVHPSHYNETGRVGPTGTQPILRSSGVRTNGRTG